MDPITTAIVAALPALTSDLIKASVKDAYGALKAVILKKWSQASPVSRALSDLEKDPKSRHEATALAESLARVHATSDTEVMQAVAKLIKEMKKEGVGGPTIANITISVTGGTVGVAGAQNVSIGSMNLGISSPSEN
jgi:hypothetical protein